MTKLDELIQEFCPNGVSFASISELLKKKQVSTITPTIKVKRNDYSDTGVTPIISQEIEYISGYCNLYDKNIPQGNYVCFGDHSECVKYINFSFVQGADGLKIMRTDENNISARYLFHALLSKYQRHNNYERHFKYLMDTILPVPPLPVQREIVRILDNFTELTEELTEELTARKKQYAYYRDKLLTMDNEQVAMCNLGDIADIYTGSKPDEILDTISDYEYINAGTGNSGYTEQPNCEGDTVTTPSRGQGGIGYVGYQSKPFYLGPLCYAIRSKTQEFIINKYIYHWLVSHSSDILVLKNEGGTPALNKADLAKIRIKVPSLPVQNRLVEVLDNFDAICTDLNIGLPAEIEARKKQYEYYRDKLLSFQEVPANEQKEGLEKTG